MEKTVEDVKKVVSVLTEEQQQLLKDVGVMVNTSSSRSLLPKVSHNLRLTV